VVGKRGQNFREDKRWKKKNMRAGRMGFLFSRAHPQLVHWWLLVYSSRDPALHQGLHQLCPAHFLYHCLQVRVNHHPPASRAPCRQQDDRWCVNRKHIFLVSMSQG
jgi:hypothetical protein